MSPTLRASIRQSVAAAVAKPPWRRRDAPPPGLPARCRQRRPAPQLLGRKLDERCLRHSAAIQYRELCCSQPAYRRPSASMVATTGLVNDSTNATSHTGYKDQTTLPSLNYRHFGVRMERGSWKYPSRQTPLARPASGGQLHPAPAFPFQRRGAGSAAGHRREDAAGLRLLARARHAWVTVKGETESCRAHAEFVGQLILQPGASSDAKEAETVGFSARVFGTSRKSTTHSPARNSNGGP